MIPILIRLIGFVFRSKAYFHVKKRSTMESLKVISARSVAARVTLKKSFEKLEVPRSLLGELLVAHEDPWRKLRIKNQTMCESWSAENKSKINNVETTDKRKRESTKEKIHYWVMSMESWKKCPYCKYCPVNQKKLLWHICTTKSCKKKQDQFLTSTEEKKYTFTF